MASSGRRSTPSASPSPSESIGSPGSTGPEVVTSNGKDALEPPPGGGFTTASSWIPAVARLAGRVTTSRAEDEKLDVTGAPSNVTADSTTKPSPINCSSIAPPALAVGGTMANRTGVPKVSSSGNGTLGPRDGSGLAATTSAVPGAASALAGTVTSRRSAEMKAAGSATPSKVTDAPGKKPAPRIARGVSSLLTGIDGGSRPVICGAGVGASSIENVAASLVPPPGRAVKTVIASVPAAPRSSAGIVARSSEAEVQVVASSAAPNRTIESRTKPAPSAVSSSSGAPALAAVGLIDASTGGARRSGRNRTPMRSAGFRVRKSKIRGSRSDRASCSPARRTRNV